jgi:hypothetical protein
MKKLGRPQRAGLLVPEILLPLLGAMALVLPWVFSNAPYKEGESPWPFLPYGTSNGLISWHGVAAGVACASLFLLLLPGVALKPYQARLSRAVPFVLAGVLLIVLSGMFMVEVRNVEEAEKVRQIHREWPYVDRQGDEQKGREQDVRLILGVGPYVELCVGVGLLVVAALEMRAMWRESAGA